MFRGGGGVRSWFRSGICRGLLRTCWLSIRCVVVMSIGVGGGGSPFFVHFIFPMIEDDGFGGMRG